MPYSITTKDGITINNIPDDIPPDAPELKARVARIRSGDMSKPQAPKEAPRGPDAIPGVNPNMRSPDVPPVTLYEQMLGMGSPIASFVKGAVVNPLVGVNQLLANTGLFGQQIKQGANALASNLEQNSAYAKERIGRSGFDVPELLGSVLSPVNKLFGPATGANKVETIARGAASAMGQTAIAPTAKTDNYFEEKASDMVVAGLLGGALPVGVMAVKGGASLAKKLSEPLTEEGKKNLIRSWFNSRLPADKEKVLVALRNAKELVPGSKPTVAEALADIPESTTIASAQKNLAGMSDGGISQQFSSRTAAQQAAREKAIGSIAQTKQALDEAIKDRSDFANAVYSVAYKQLTDFNPQLRGLMETPAFKSAIPKALEIAKNNGFQTSDDIAKLVTYAPDFFKGVVGSSKKEVTNSNLTQFLHFVKKAMDDQVSRPAAQGGLDASQRASVQAVRKNLIGWMTENNANYSDARDVYAALSPRIDQMRIGQYLQEKLSSALDVERAGVFAKAVQDAPLTIKKATGETVYDSLEQALTPKQVAAVRSVEADLVRMSKAAQNAKRTRSSTGGGPDDAPELPNLLNRWATITNTVLKTMKKGVNDDLNQQIGQLLLEPKDLAGFLSTMPKEPGKAKVIASAIMERLTPENRAAFAAALTQQEE